MGRCGGGFRKTRAVTTLNASAVEQKRAGWPISARPPCCVLPRRPVGLLCVEPRLVQHQTLLSEVLRARVAAAAGGAVTAACATRLASGVMALAIPCIGRYWTLAMLRRADGVDVRHGVEA